MIFPKIKHIAFKAGGAKGYAHIGVSSELERLGLAPKIQEVAGTSVGAIFALFFASGLPTADIEKFAFSTDFGKLIKSRWTIFALWNLITKGGLHDGAELYQFIKDFIKLITNNEDTTFAQWHDLRQKNPKLKDFTVEACNISRGVVEIFNCNSPRHKDIPIWKAVAASSAFPGYIVPMEIELIDENGVTVTEKFSDGGIQNICPINLFNLAENQPNPEAIGIWLASTADILLVQNGTLPAVEDVSGLPAIFQAQVTAQIEGNTFRLYQSNFKKQMILCDTLNIDTFDFNLTNQQKEMLKLSGIISVFRYMAKNYPEFAAFHYSPKQFELLGITQAKLKSCPPLKTVFPHNTYASLLTTLKTLPEPDIEHISEATSPSPTSAAFKQLVLTTPPKALTLAKDYATPDTPSVPTPPTEAPTARRLDRGSMRTRACS